MHILTCNNMQNYCNTAKKHYTKMNAMNDSMYVRLATVGRSWPICTAQGFDIILIISLVKQYEKNTSTLLCAIHCISK